MNVNDKVYVADWGQHYSKIGGGNGVFKWNIEIPLYSSTSTHWRTITEPKLTQKGVPFKNGERIVKERIPLYKNYKYTIAEIQQHPNDKNVTICLLKSNEGCFVEMGIKGISKLTPEQYAKKEFNALEEAHLKKWQLGDDMKKFPKELLLYLYDKNQRTLFGSETTGATIRYPYIHEKFTINNIPICLGWEQSFDGGCDLKDKEVITWDELKKKFPLQKFQ